MRIAVLLRFPHLDNSPWKKRVLDELLNRGHQVSLYFGDKNYWREFKAIVKEFGPFFYKKKSAMTAEGRVNLRKAYRDRIPVNLVHDLNGKRCCQTLKAWQPDYLLLLGTGILREPVLQTARFGAVHCHHGHLPQFRGVNTAEWSYLLQGRIFLTTHFVNAGVDTGDILLRKEIPVKPSDSIATIREKCREESVTLLLETFAELENGTCPSLKQNADEGVQYYSMHSFFKRIIEDRIVSAAKD